MAPIVISVVGKRDVINASHNISMMGRGNASNVRKIVILIKLVNLAKISV